MMRLIILLTLVIFNQTVSAQNASIAKGNEFYKEGRYDLAEAQYRRAGNDPVAN
jgi:hypothetical protein